MRNLIKNTFSDYDGNVIELSAEILFKFKNLVAEIKNILNCNTEIVNGDLDELDENTYVKGVNFNHGEIIIIDNITIHDAFTYGLIDSLKETICHEIAHNKYWNHTRWHKELTRHYFELV